MIKTNQINMMEIENLFIDTFDINKNKRLITTQKDYKQLICWL